MLQHPRAKLSCEDSAQYRHRGRLLCARYEVEVPFSSKRGRHSRWAVKRVLCQHDGIRPRGVAIMAVPRQIFWSELAHKMGTWKAKVLEEGCMSAAI